jgi:hypothetical protein
MHRAVLSILAGHVFPRPPRMLRWRLWLFYICIRVQRKFALVRRRKSFSLREQEPGEWGAREDVAEDIPENKDSRLSLGTHSGLRTIKEHQRREAESAEKS